MLGSADRGNGHGKDHPAYHNGSDQGDIYAADSSTCQGFLDPHERDQDLPTKGLLSSPIRPHLCEFAVEYAPPMTPPARTPVKVRGHTRVRPNVVQKM